MSIWIATVGALDKSNASQTLRFSDVSFIDNDGNYFENRMLQPALIKVSPDDGGTFKIFSSPSIGEIELINKDGGLNYLMDYALDNGNISLSLVNDDGSRNDYLTGKVESMRFSGDMVYLTVRSMSEVLTRNHVNNKFLGNNALPNGVEGVAGDIKGNIKPRVFGDVKNATPVLVNTSRLIYQFSDRDTATVSAVYDKGAALTVGTTYTWANFATFQTAAVTAGQFNRCAGFVKLGSTPVGTVTGDCSDSTTNAGDVFEVILTEESLTLNSSSKTLLNTFGSVGLYVTSETSTTQLLNQIVQSCGCYWYFLQSVVYVKQIVLATTSTLDLTDSENITIDIVATGLGSNGLPIAAISMQYDKIESVQQETELAGSVTAARKAVLSQQYRNSFVTDSAVQTRHPLAGSIKIDSVLRGTSTNLSINSEVISASTGTGVTSNAIVSPDGNTTADFIYESSTTSEHFANDISIAVTSGEVYTWSCYVKQGFGSRKFYIRLATAVSAVAVFDLSTNTFSGVTAGATARSESLSNGWYRVSLTATMSSTANLVARLQLWSTTSVYTGDGTSGMYFWGRQLELGGSATGYIQTTSLAVSKDRALEVATNLLNIAKVRCDVVNITAIVRDIPAIDLGDGVLVTSNKLGYDYGKLLTIIGFQIDAKRKEIILECIG